MKSKKVLPKTAKREKNVLIPLSTFDNDTICLHANQTNLQE